MNAAPAPMATILRRVLSMAMSLRNFVEEDRNSEVMSRNIAVIASQRPMSEIDKGKIISYAPMICSARICSSGDTSSLWIVTMHASLRLVLVRVETLLAV